MHPVFIVATVTVILAFIKILVCQLIGFSEYIRELVVESQNLLIPHRILKSLSLLNIQRICADVISCESEGQY